MEYNILIQDKKLKLEIKDTKYKEVENLFNLELQNLYSINSLINSYKNNVESCGFNGYSCVFEKTEVEISHQWNEDNVVLIDKDIFIEILMKWKQTYILYNE